MTTRREFFKKGILAGAGFALLKNSLGTENNPAVQPETLNLEPATDFILPPLPYAYDALEPFIDKQTMEIHHTKHHQAYINKLNDYFKDSKAIDPSDTLDNICSTISKYPVTVRNNAGGHYNHSLFWKLMKPNAGSVLAPPAPNVPTGNLADVIKSSFDSFENFKTKFSETAMKVFGSGWAWLVINKDGKLEIGSTPNQDNPRMDLSAFKGKPVIALDVWEHAYYLKYQNRRTDYVTSWWNVVNWETAGTLFDK